MLDTFIWSDIDEALVIGHEMIQETTDKIRLIQTWIRTAQSRQKSCDDKKRRPEFEVGDKVFLKVSPTKGVKRFNVHGKISPRFIGPYYNTKKINKVAYCITRPTKFFNDHNALHISQLGK